MANLGVEGTPTDNVEFKLAEDNEEKTFDIKDGALVIAEEKTVKAEKYTVKITATEIANPLNTITKDVIFTAKIGE